MVTYVGYPIPPLTSHFNREVMGISSKFNFNLEVMCHIRFRV